MTAENYLAFFGEIYGLSAQEIKVRSNQLFAALSLEPDGKKIGEFSKGMKRKVAIARSLIHDPKFLVYDEATSGLDPMTSRFIADYLRTLKKEGKTIVLSAHNLYQVEAVCDKVMILKRGKMVAFGNMNQLRDQFGSLTYTIFFSIDDPGRLIGHSKTYRKEEGFYTADAQDIDESTNLPGLFQKREGKWKRSNPGTLPQRDAGKNREIAYEKVGDSCRSDNGRMHPGSRMCRLPFGKNNRSDSQSADGFSDPLVRECHPSSLVRPWYVKVLIIGGSPKAPVQLTGIQSDLPCQREFQRL